MYNIKDSGDRSEFETGAVRDLQKGKGRFDLLPWETIQHVALHFEKGSEKYGERNWERGIPLCRYYDSAFRHLSQDFRGLVDENHLVAAIWNLLCLYQTKLWIKEGKLDGSLDDRPHKNT